jgi:transcriptional regulator with XRE-family HTH domain
MAPRHPNARLRALAQEAGWSGAALARAVNRAGAEIGLTLRYDRTSVAHWMAGTRPPAAVAAVVAETLTRKLGRPLGLTELGFAVVPVEGNGPLEQGVAQPGAAENGATEYGPTARTALLDLAELDAVRPGTRPYRLTTSRRLSLAASAPAPTRTSGAERVTPAHVRAAQDMLRTFTTVDSAFGGGHSRAALTGFLRSSVAGWLATPAAPRTRRELLLVSSALACLAGSMCFDEHRHGVAQGYYQAAARLAAEADDAPGQAAALRGLSVQAQELGHRAHALELAEAASAQRSRLPTWLAAAVTGQLAVAAAARGERRRALTVLQRSAELLGRSEEYGDYHRAAHEHHESEVLSALGDRAGAVAALRRSLQLRPPEERRTRAVGAARLGELLLDGGALEQACASWHAFLDDYPLLRSARADRAVRTLRSRLRPFHGTAAARGVLGRLQPLCAQA